MTPTQMLNSYKRAAERIKERFGRLSYRQRRSSLSRKAGAATARVRIDYMNLTAAGGFVRAAELWPRTPETEWQGYLEALGDFVEVRLSGTERTVWVRPVLGGNGLNGKITARTAVAEPLAGGGRVTP